MLVAKPRSSHSASCLQSSGLFAQTISNRKKEVSRSPSGPGTSSDKELGNGLYGLGSIPSVGGVEIFLYSFVSRLVLGSTQSPIKMSTGGSPRGKGGRAQGQPYLFLVRCLCNCMWILASTSPCAFVALHGNTFVCMLP